MQMTMITAQIAKAKNVGGNERQCFWPTSLNELGENNMKGPKKLDLWFFKLLNIIVLW